MVVSLGFRGPRRVPGPGSRTVVRTRMVGPPWADVYPEASPRSGLVEGGTNRLYYENLSMKIHSAHLSPPSEETGQSAMTATIASLACPATTPSMTGPIWFVRRGPIRRPDGPDPISRHDERHANRTGPVAFQALKARMLD